MQVLKPEIYNDILINAFELIDQEGLSFKMADLAKHCNVTPGNLYRYFDNKAAIIKAITQPALDDIDELVSRASLDKISFKTSDFDEFFIDIEIMSKDLTYLYFKHGLSLEILATESSMIDSIMTWLSSLLTNYYRKCNETRPEVLANMVSNSLYSGILIVFNQQKELNLSDDELESLIKSFLTKQLYKG